MLQAFVGKKVKKSFLNEASGENKMYSGVITKFDKRRGFLVVDYEDRDWEHWSANDVEACFGDSPATHEYRTAEEATEAARAEKQAAARAARAEKQAAARAARGSRAAPTQACYFSFSYCSMLVRYSWPYMHILT